MSNPWDDEFNGSGSLNVAWSNANSPISPTRTNGRAVFGTSLGGDHHAGIMKDRPVTFLNKDFVTKFSFGGVQDNLMCAGMAWGSSGNGPGSCIGVWLNSNGSTYSWNCLEFTRYDAFLSNHGTHAVGSPAVSGGYIRIRTPVMVGSPTVFQFSENGRTFTTLYSGVVDLDGVPQLYLTASGGSTLAVTASFDFARCLPHGAPVIRARSMFAAA